MTGKRVRLRPLAILTFVVAVLGMTEAQAEHRIALIIGNSAYVNVGLLANPQHDANAMEKLFREANFTTVEAKSNLGVIQFRHVLADFQVLAKDADVAVIYYSGHGIEYAGHNYLVPIDAKLDREVDVQDEAVSLDRVLDAIAGASRLKLVILDACRTDPFKTLTRTRAVNRGFNRIDPPESDELVAYSAKAGTVAQDGAEGDNSPYTAALLKRLRTPGLDVELALRQVRDDVMQGTHNLQEPYYYGSIGGTIISIMPGNSIGHEETASLKAPEMQIQGGPQKAPEKPERIARPEDRGNETIGECDKLAALPFDAMRPRNVPGVVFGILDAERAIPACSAAYSFAPQNARIVLELARSLEKNKDYKNAFHLYQKSVDLGYQAAMIGLGHAYMTGRGVAEDDREALRWFRRAAEAGDPAGMNNLGHMYEKGRGVAEEDAEAVKWYRKAAEAADPAGMNNLGRMYEKGHGIAEDDAEAVKWFRKSAEAGDAGGMSNLGRMYESGRGVTEDDGEASKWYRKAAEAGSRVAKRYLAPTDEQLPQDFRRRRSR